VPLPGIGVAAQAVLDVQGENVQVERYGRGDRRVQERRRISPAAVGDGDGPARDRAVSARSCR
jgi:hypothetical protein